VFSAVTDENRIFELYLGYISVFLNRGSHSTAPMILRNIHLHNLAVDQYCHRVVSNIIDNSDIVFSTVAATEVVDSMIAKSLTGSIILMSMNTAPTI